MNAGDLNKVWEIIALKKKPREDEARKLLERIANQVQPIMRNRKWRVKLLSEFCPKNGRLLGLNVNRGVNVKLRLRRPNREDEFYPYEEVLDTMLHELCHNVRAPHDATFYKLWDELRKECEDLISRGVSGSGEGFDLPGRRLGGPSRQPPLSALRRTAADAAQKRAVLGTLLPSGPRRLGGDNDIMSALSPMQAAAMAAERRLHDDIWCGSGSCQDQEEIENSANIPQDFQCAGENQAGPRDVGPSRRTSVSVSRKRSHEPVAKSNLHSPKKKKQQSNFVDLTKDASTSFPSADSPPTISRYKRVEPDSVSLTGTKYNSSVPSCSNANNGSNDNPEEKLMWECVLCTLRNPPLAPLCEICSSERPQDNMTKFKLWSCKFCTLENIVELDRCSACQQWRYSTGAPVSAFPLHWGD